MKPPAKHEAIFWSIALPGLAQILNGKLFKGTLLIGLEFLINVQSNFNLAILYSFTGAIEQAAFIVDYQWLMFYPCIYLFGMWDAYRDAEGNGTRYDYLPFVFTAFSVTVGLMYSSANTYLGHTIGPIFFPILCVIPGILIGLTVKKTWLYVKH
ncbi:hypothetical protein NC799_07240 [Aquibacillus sp. 3ASR75-54]|uniref:Uncharacterized protein n=2 Tax=Aquibacillus salsiterrae TaxID=2950439 RepID=A0A9X4AEF3_9BACI|nr:hypothetical protein [Aquibacillus salsiterrae]MDC3416711.1 hypothetical protein [Aquibacillus salsiterrae]